MPLEIYASVKIKMICHKCGDELSCYYSGPTLSQVSVFPCSRCSIEREFISRKDVYSEGFIAGIKHQRENPDD